MKILFTNDDGYSAIGIQTLYKIFMDDYECQMCAPLHHKSAFSHAINYYSHFDIVPLEAPLKGFALDSTPADTMRAAVLGLFEEKFDLVLSGINYGVNISQDVFYSGTVAAAREATFHGMFAIASSLELEDHQYHVVNIDIEKAFGYAASIIKKIVKALPKEIFSYKGSLLNINFPSTIPAKGIKVVELGSNKYSTSLDYKDGQIKIQSKDREVCSGAGTDCYELARGYIVITALKDGVVLDPVLQSQIKFLEEISPE